MIGEVRPHARRVLDDAVDQPLVVERRAVLGDPDLEVAVVGAQPNSRSCRPRASTSQPIAVIGPRDCTVSACSGASGDSRTVVGE
jgi:hypothetical protein